ncbi:MAG: hypothetical protein ACREQI_03665 [Candidatus Binataceae bacterium]
MSVPQWSQNVAQAETLGHGAGFVLFIQVFVLAFMVLFIWLVARRHKNWARWLLLVTFILGLPSYVLMRGPMLRSNPLAGSLNLAQLAAQVGALFLIFTGNARSWFQNGPENRPLADSN